MYIIKIKIALLVNLFLLQLACSGGGVQGGSLSLTFSGVKTAQVLSPTSVKLSWDIVGDGLFYQVYESNNPGVALVETSFSSAIIENLQPDTSYIFKVITKGSQSHGIAKEIQVRTWPRFKGISRATVNPDGSVELSWTYDYLLQNFEIFYQKASSPTALNTANWTAIKGLTQANTFLVNGLEGSSKYYFVVHARYRSEEYEITPQVVSATTLTGFSTPLYELSPVSIGALPSLRVDPIADANYAVPFYKSQVFWKGEAISDPLIGAGTIVFSSTANLPIGKIEGLSLHVTYNDGNRNEFMQIDGLSTYIKGVSPHIENVPLVSLGKGESYLGKVLARGDFNCDGADDLAIGAPDVSLSQFGVRSARSGAVFIYYSKKNIETDRYELITHGVPQLNPARMGEDPQVITFDDLNHAQFGAALSSGNLNGDRNGLNSCDDLVVGTAGESGSGGLVITFFGSLKGLRSPSRMADIPINAATCDGKLEGATCTAVSLSSRMSYIPSVLTGGQVHAIPDQYNDSYIGFGKAVSFIGDFNADGYEDIAVGNPVAVYPGSQVRSGAVYIFFGSKYGLGKEKPDLNYPNQEVSFVPIFPAIPYTDMLFGASISGGADVDGRYKVRLADGSLVGGADMVIGAPGFPYINYTDAAFSEFSGQIGTTPDSAKILSLNSGWQAGGVSLAAPESYYGIPQDTVRIGAAFLYFGYGRTTPATGPADNDNSSLRTAFWQCGRRGFSPQDHWSCLIDNTNVRLLSPRDASTRRFGASVQLIGDPSRFKDNSNNLRTHQNTLVPEMPLQYFSDANGDGFADVVVAAPETTVSNKARVGVLWQFFGNFNRAFEAGDFYNLDGSEVPENDWSLNDPQCASFAVVDANTKINCRPVLLRSPSLSAGSSIGITQAAIAAGDVTGDGLKDLVAGAPGDNVNGVGSGSILVFTSLKEKGLTSNFKKLYSTKAEQADSLGTSVVVGNFNGDFFAKAPVAPTTVPTLFPYGDVFGGAPMDEYDRNGGGGVYGFLSNEFPLPATLATENIRISEQSNALQFSGLNRIRFVGDINGDGYDDAILPVKNIMSDGAVSSEAVVYYGSAIGLISTDFCLANKERVFLAAESDNLCYPNLSPSLGITRNEIVLPQKIIRPASLPTNWFTQAYEVGDVNADGFADVLFVSERSVSLFFGARGGLQNVVDPTWQPSLGDPQIVSDSLHFSGSGNSSYHSWEIGYTENNNFIFADYNGDGFMDLAIGLPDVSSPSMNVDEAFPPRPTTPGSVANGNGWVCASADVNCRTGIPIIHHGAFILLYGSENGYQTPRNTGMGTEDLSLTSVDGMFDLLDSENSPDKPCVVDGNGKSICKTTFLRNPVFENMERGYEKQQHYFGASLTSMDVNKDGYQDLLVSAPYYDDPSCWNSGLLPKRYGKVYIFYGSERGLAAGAREDYYNTDIGGGTCADPQTDPSTGLMPGSKLRALMPTVEGQVTSDWGRQFGAGITNVGDINNDGFDDFISRGGFEGFVGLENIGMFYLYYGPLCPADNMMTVSQAYQYHDTDRSQLNTQMYFSGAQPPGTASTNIFTGTLGTAGTSCYRGSGGSLKPLPLKFYSLSAGARELWGTTLVGASGTKADFNGDGYADILIGSSSASDVARDIDLLGLGIVYFGSPEGLFVNDFPSTSVVKNSDGYNRPFLLVPPHSERQLNFFRGNTSIGDVNNDGTVDYMITSPNYDGSGSKRGIDLGTFFIFF